MGNNDYLKWGREILYGNGEIMMGEREGSPRQLKKEANQNWQRIFKPIKERKELWSKKVDAKKAEQKAEAAVQPVVAETEPPKKVVKRSKVKKPSKRKTKK